MARRKQRLDALAARLLAAHGTVTEVIELDLAAEGAVTELARRRGGIVLVSSAVAFAPVPYTANYAAAKAYIASLGQALHYELKPAGVDVLTLAPGPVRTEGAANAEGIDFGKLPVPSMQPSPVVRAALRALGGKPLVIPGPLNKASDFADNYLTPRRAQTAMFGALVSRALDEKPQRG